MMTHLAPGWVNEHVHADLCSDPHLIVFLLLPRRVEDEAVLDRGASFVKHVCDEEEVEGKLSDGRGEKREKNHRHII